MYIFSFNLFTNLSFDCGDYQQIEVISITKEELLTPKR